MKLCSEELCSGCGACVNVCPQKCISMKRNNQGFDYPVIDAGRCIDCKQCDKVCDSVQNGFDDRSPQVYSITMKNDDVSLEKSSSGGAAYALSKRFIETGGVVFGAAYSETLQVDHVCVYNISDLRRLQGSKYVQSSTGHCYSDVKQKINAGTKVLYFGTPCQIHGLYSYLGKTNLEPLFTCDLLCGGVPSPGLFERYVKDLKKKTGDDFDGYNFRSKKYGYGYGYLIQTITGNKKRTLTKHDASFVKTMGAGYVRESCFGCRFGSISRVGDITIGDFRGIKVNTKQWNKGVSLLFVNNEKGQELLSSCIDELIIDKRTIEDAEKSQHCALTGSKKKPYDYDSFFSDCSSMDWYQVSKKYFSPRSPKEKIKESIPLALLGAARRIRR